MAVPAEEPPSLLDFATGLATDPALRARLAAEPRTVLDEQHLADLPPADLHHSLPLVTDSVAARLGTDADVTGLTAGALIDGEDPVDALARHFGSLTDTVTVGDPVPIDDVESEPDDVDHDPDPDSDLDHDLDDLDGVADTVPSPDPAPLPLDHTAQEATTMTSPTSTPGTAEDQHAELLSRIDGFFSEAEQHGVARPATPEEWLADYGPDAVNRFFDTYEPGDRAGEEYIQYTNDMLVASRAAPVGDVPDPAETALPSTTSGSDDAAPGPEAIVLADPDTDLDDVGGSGATGSDVREVGESEIPAWLSHDDQGRWYDNGDRSDVVGSAPNPTDTPGTPQGWHSLTLEAQSHGYPDAQSYLTEVSRDDMAGLAWEPGNRSAAHGELQAYLDAADTAGLSPADYGAANTYTPEQIDAAYAASDGSDVGQDTDLDGFGESVPVVETADEGALPSWMSWDESQGLWVDNGTPDPGADPQVAGGDLTATDTDLDDVGSPAPAGDTYVPHGDDPFMDTVNAGGGSSASPTGGGTDLDDFGSGSAGDSSDTSAAGNPAGSDESFGTDSSDPSSDDVAGTADAGGSSSDAIFDDAGSSDDSSSGGSDDDGSSDAGSDDGGDSGAESF